MTAIAMLCWGGAYVPSAWMLEGLPPLAAAGLRLGLAGLALLVFARATGRSLRPGAPWPAVAWLGLTQTAVFYGATYWVIGRESAGLAAVIANTDALFVAVLGWLLLGEALSARQWVGIALGFAGAALAGSPDAFAPRLSAAVLVLLAGAACWGFGTITATRHLRGDGSPLALAGWQMVAGAGMLAVVNPLVGGEYHVDARVAAITLGVALVGSAAPLGLFYAALRTGAAGELSAMFFLVPVVGVLTAWPLLGERPHAGLVVGLAAVCVGLVMVLWRPRGGRLVPSPESHADFDAG